MKLRPAKTEELATIRAKRVESYEQYGSVLPQEHWQILKEGLASDSDTGPGVQLIVAEVDGQITGSVVLFPAKTDAYAGLVEELDYPEIRMLAVHPEFRQQGIASALVSECIRRARESGAQSVGLHTGEFMTAARKLYTKLGFERLPQCDFQPADDGITVMAYRLQLS